MWRFRMKKANLTMTMVVATLLIGCSSYDTEYNSTANPASVYCVQQGGELEAVTENEGRVTYCVFSDDERVEQWQYYRDNHKQSETY